jgi:hypothetical protein
VSQALSRPRGLRIASNAVDRDRVRGIYIVLTIYRSFNALTESLNGLYKSELIHRK